MDRILIEDLAFDCIIGILEEERVKEQKLHVDVSLGCDLSTAASSGKVSDTVDYFALAERIKAFARQRKARLLEELGQELCQMIFNEFKVSEITLKLMKSSAVPGARGAGIELFRKRV